MLGQVHLIVQDNMLLFLHCLFNELSEFFLQDRMSGIYLVHSFNGKDRNCGVSAKFVVDLTILFHEEYSIIYNRTSEKLFNHKIITILCSEIDFNHAILQKEQICYGVTWLL
jgi:hypothetical protein